MNYKNNKLIEITNNSNCVIIDWVLGNYCNYKCSYCFPGSNTGDQRPPKISKQIKKNIKHLVSEIKQDDNSKKIINFTLSGGEPTVYHDLENLIRFLTKLGIITVVTNGSRTLTWWENNWKYFNHVIVSYHVESAEFNHTLQLVTFLSSKIPVSLHVMIPSNNFDKCVDLYNTFNEKLKNSKVSVQAKFIRQPNGSLSYTEDQLSTLLNLTVYKKRRSEIFDEQIFIKTDVENDRFDFKSIGHLEGSFFNYGCSAHKEFLQIDRFGNVGTMSCGTTFNDTANIIDSNFIEKFKIKDKYVSCKSIRCGCLGLYKTSKKLILKN
jgi:organic radical activating enzyme